MKLPQDILNALRTVEGWLFEGEAFMLAKYASMATQCIVEIGTYRGRSAIIMALAAPENTPVYSVDPHITSPGDNQPFGDEDRQVWTENVVSFGMSAKIRPINLKSQDVAKIWSEPISLLFIDGAHGYEAVRDDLAGWIPHIAPDGFVACHDNNWPEVARAIDERTDLILVEQSNITSIFKVSK